MNKPALALLATLAVMVLPNGVLGQSNAPAQVEALPSPDLAFAPDEVTIVAGGTVEWTNKGGFHTVTSSDSREDGMRRANGVFDEVLSGDGATVSWTITEPGTYYYFCQPHSNVGMAGTIVVTGEESDTGGDAETGSSPSVGLVAATLGLLAFLAIARRRTA